MTKTFSLVLFVSLVLQFAAPGYATQKRRAHPVQHKQAPAKPPPIDEQALKTQIMLDRAGYSPGEIDGALGISTRRALEVFTKNGGKPDALPADAVTTYRITAADAAGPFTPDIPSDMMAMAKLPALGYKNLLEALGERFHCSPALLRRLNPTAKFAEGEEIQVPNVLQTIGPVGPPRGSQSDSSNPAATTVTVHKSSSDLIVTDGTGRPLMYAPVTTGSEHDPLPIGEWKVTGVQRNPKFHYNPDLFWDADAKQAKATIPPGPNNPVGVIWIDLSRPHYGLHGTPEPSTIGKTTSHGCVRLTNWDAEKLASIVRPGTKVIFAE